MNVSQVVSSVTVATAQVSRYVKLAINYYIFNRDSARYQIESVRLALVVWDFAVAERDRLQRDPLPRTVLLSMGFLVALYAVLKVTVRVGRKLAPVLLVLGLVFLVTMLYEFIASSAFWQG